MTVKLYTLDNVFIKEDVQTDDNFTGIAEYSYGSKEWFVNGEWHRLDGPAVEWLDGTKIWYMRDKLHRIDGPAFIGIDGEKEWHVDGKQVTELQCKLLCDIMRLKGLL